MNKINIFSIVLLLSLGVILPVYGVMESNRLQGAQEVLREQYLAEASDIYLEACVNCHGFSGEGVGVTPALDNPAFSLADEDLLFRKIAHPPHGSAMDVWHSDDGPELNDYQVEALVTLIKYPDWTAVAAKAEAKQVSLPVIPIPELEAAFVDGPDAKGDPHECIACHEEPAVHADRFGMNCAYCHSLAAWKPALLVRHIFPLDHGQEGQVACQTCHSTSYSEHTCYGCHDHVADDMQVVHEQEAISDYETCVACHPTGIEGEGQRYWEAIREQPESGSQAEDVKPGSIALGQANGGK